MLRLLTSCSKDKRKREATFWYLSQKVKGQLSCDFLVALYLKQNIFTPLKNTYFWLCKKMKDYDRKRPEHQKTERLFVKVSNGSLPIELWDFAIFVELCMH